MKSTLKLAFIASAALAVSACSTSPTVDTPLKQDATRRAELAAELPRTLAPAVKVAQNDDIHIPVVARKVSEYAWLRSKKITVHASKEPVPMAEILRALSKQGLSITTELPLDRYQYTGFSLVDIDAESALRAIVSTVGLDYQVDDSRKLISIKPMSSKTWYLNIGNRRSNFSAGGTTSTAGGAGNNAIASSLSGGGGASSSAQAASSTNKTEVTSSDDFWGSLKTELDARLKLMLPDPQRAAAAAAAPVVAALPSLPLPGVAPGTAAPPQLMAVAAPAAASTEGGLSYSSKQVGSFSMNPETGAVSVQAPHWILDDLGTYFKRVQEMYNTDIMFQGELILLSVDEAKSEGLDISSFAQFASSKYGLAFRNNGLGGVTMSVDNAATALLPGVSRIPNVAAGANAIAGPLIGITSPASGLQIFNAYLSSMGQVTTLQRPALTTTSGVPADFRRIVTRYFNTVTQQTATGGTGSATVGTQNNLIAQDFGTVLRVNPRVDISTGMIRAQIELVQTTQTGTQDVTQTVSTGSNVEQVVTPLPIVSKIIYSGEALLKDGDLIVMGGQTEDAENTSRSGVTGLMDVENVSGIFGKKMTSKTRNVFYFAMRVSVTKR